MEDYQQASMYEPEKVVEVRPFLLGRRLCVLGLYSSFFGCLIALWLTGTLFGHVYQVLPAWLMQVVAGNRYLILAVPLACLIGCYLGLRYQTGEIMVSPERFLDERQKLIRDRAHRQAYKVMKLGALLVPLAICAGALLWPAQTPVSASTRVVAPVGMTYAVVSRSAGPASQTLIDLSSTQHINLLLLGFDGQKGQDTAITFVMVNAPQGGSYDTVVPSGSGGMAMSWVRADMVQQAAGNRNLTSPTVHPAWPLEPADAGIYYGALLLSLFLVASALPMSMVAWKERGQADFSE